MEYEIAIANTGSGNFYAVRVSRKDYQDENILSKLINIIGSKQLIVCHKLPPRSLEFSGA